MKKDVVHQSRCITFSQTYIEELSDRFDSDLSRVFMPSKFSPIALEAVSLLSRILSLVQTADASAMYMEGMVQQLLSLLINDYTANTDSKRDCSISESDRCGVQNVASYLLEQYAQPIAVKTLEQVAFMGKTKLSCLFRQQYGMTLFSFLQKVRMEKAEELLVQTDLSIGEIMRQVGYSNLSGFTECFKRTTGYAPTQYRRQPE
ncbi:MAG: AraC family transcriptional regulator [Ethanoligenens sp.]